MQSVDRKPMFLPGVQNNPQPSPYFDIDQVRARIWPRILADLAPLRVPSRYHCAPRPLHPGNHARTGSDAPRAARIDRYLYFLSQPL